MTVTFVLLLVAHSLGDFLLQPAVMVRRKRNPAILAAHGAIHLALGVALIGAWHPGLLALVVAHLAIDAVKTFAGPGGLAPFLWDQAAHLASLAIAAMLLPPLWQTGLWPDLLGLETATALLVPLLHLAGLVIAARAGGFAVGLLLAPFLAAAPQITADSLPRAGQVIGLLERGIAYLLTITGQPTAVAFLVAAKSILRFEAARDDRRVAEYIIVGTLASIGWALTTALAIDALAARLTGAAP